MHNIFHMSLLKQNTIKKGQIDETTSQLEFDKDGNGKKYKLERLCDSAVYAKESKGFLPRLYYLFL